MKYTSKMLLVVCVSLLVAATAQADIVTVQQGVSGYAGTDDNSVWAHQNGGTDVQGDNNYGGRNYTFLGDPFGGVTGVPGGEGKGLLRFDLSNEISTLQSVSGISLTFKESGNSTSRGTGTINIYRIAAANSAWVEGVNQAAAATGESTWKNLAHPGTAWAGSVGLGTAGTDYVNTLLGSFTFDNTQGATYTVDLATGDAALRLSLIQEWSGTQANNAGLLFVIDGASTNPKGGLSLASSEDGTASFRPKLEVDYVVPEPATMSLLGIGGLLALVRRKR